ncbi:MAG TPA: sulfurtransferase [Steroidobacteraceae bacterium]|jgi:thiosulfate/3-mercaptopyruvate sulfurtransferase|nr:sulfurtransferase [Steroidobacteraceae bacterium]
MRPFTTLIDTAALASQLERADVAIFDCRFELGKPAWGESEFAREHIAGAQYLHLDRDLSGPITPRTGRHPLPDPHQFARRIAALGAGPGMQLVAYDQGNGAYAARFWWMARWIGIRQVAVLDGGLAAWRSAGLPLETSTRAPAPRDLAVTLSAHAEVNSAALDELRQRPGTLLVDARGADRFAGLNETIDPVAGHVPGARNMPFAGNLGADGKFLPPEKLRQRWEALLGSQPPSSLIAMCGSGVTACQNLLALEHAGLGGARLYAGSWSEWIRDPRRPIATGSY